MEKKCTALSHATISAARRDGIEEDEVNDDKIQTCIDASVFCEFVLRETEKNKEVHEDNYNEEFNDEQPGPSKRIRLE